MYGGKFALVPDEPVVLLETLMPVVAVLEVAATGPKSAVFLAVHPGLTWSVPDVPNTFAVVVCVWPESVTVAVCVWLTTIASLEPPVSSAVSNNGSEALKPTITRPAPNAVHVPNPNNVPGFVLTDEFV